MLTFMGMTQEDASPPASDPAVLRAAKDAAIERVDGGVPALAARLGITPKAIYQWPYVPAERVGAVSKLTGLPAHALRPDLFDAPPQLGPRDPVATSVGE
jgi:hypothetical protein